MQNEAANEILKFWQEAGPSAWWRKNVEFDEQIVNRFSDLHEQARLRQLDHWCDNPQSCLAVILVLDQFSRNMFRNSPKTFAQDEYALELAKYGVENGYDTAQNHALFGFFHLPFMHSEVLDDQQQCVELIRKGGNEGSLKAAIEHEEIIKRFGRFPHRNIVLGRKTTAEEQEFLDGGGFSG